MASMIRRKLAQGIVWDSKKKKNKKNLGKEAGSLEGKKK